MATVISIINFKGGVAKTATAISLCHAFTLLGKKCLLIDLDTQCTATTNLNEGEKITDDKTIYDALIDEDMTTPLPIYSSEIDGFDFVPASIQLRNIDVLLAARMRKEDILKTIIANTLEQDEEARKANYDYIILDCPPGDGIININAMSASDYIIAPTTGAKQSIDGFLDMKSRLEQAQRVMGIKARIISVLFTMFEKSTNLHQLSHESMKSAFPDIVSSRRIPKDIKMQYASAKNKTIYEATPYSSAAFEYKIYAEELLELLEPKKKDNTKISDC